MGTKKAPGTQFTPKGVVQGVSLVDTTSGQPVDVIEDDNGVRRLAVNTTIVAQIPQLEVNLNANEDQVAIEDPDTEAHLRIENDGSINVNCEIDAADGDNIFAVGTEDGTDSSTSHILKIGSDKNLRVKDDTANITLSAIDNKVATAANQNTEIISLASIDSKATTIDTDINTFATTNHTDLSIIKLDIDATNTKLDTVNTHLGNLETNTDGIEGLITSSNTKLDTLHSDNVTIESKQDTGNTSLSSIDTKLTTTNTEIGTTNETAPATDTATSGLNGRLQRIAQRLTTVDSDLNTFASANHSDLLSIKTDIDSTNTKLDTLHTDNGVIEGKQDTQITSLQLIDDIVHSTNASINKAALIAGQLDDVSTTVATEDNVASMRITAQRSLHVNLRKTNGVEIGTSSDPLKVDGNASSGASDAGAPVKVGAVFNSTLPTVTTGQRVDAQSDANGRLITNSVPVDGSKATYSAAIIGLVAANTPTDIFTLTGSSTKTIRVLRAEFSATQTTAGVRDLVLLKRSTANTGGTSTIPTATPHDSTSAVATAVVHAYTANPTLGTLVGIIRAKKLVIDVTSKSGPVDRVEFFFAITPSQAIVLRGTSEVFSINLNSVTSAGNLIDLFIEWTEE